MLKVLYEDQDLIVVRKPPGMESQESRGLGADLVSEIRKHLLRTGRNSSAKVSADRTSVPVHNYVGVIHRLDKPVGGILVYAKTKSAAAKLSRQAAEGRMRKKYLAVFCGKVDKNVDNLVDYLLKDERSNLSRIVDKGTAGAKRAELAYRVLEQITDERYGELALAEITLKTGRHHQIRVQMSGHGMPLWGDHKYNRDFCASFGTVQKSGTVPNSGFREDVALFAYRLVLIHPVSGREMSFEIMPEHPIFCKFSSCAPG